ncbi:hypothetical protein BGZ73_004932 [Actinomortierella ambigua]|nr:hypothetical protein BGZ73_004932 [Actinomortierella ambigua]
MAAKHALKIGARTIPLVAAHERIPLDQVTEFKPLQDWAKKLRREEEVCATKDSSSDTTVPVRVNKVEVKNVDYFGKRIGFVNLAVDAEIVETGQKAPGYIFMRGGAVAVLLILRSMEPTSGQTKEHVLVVNQARLAIPSFSFPEIPAGMLDGSGDFAGKCAEEIQEECGITMDHDSLVDMTKLAYGDDWDGMYPSVGGCDEFLRLFACCKDMSWNDLQALEGRLGGLREHGESITLSLVELKDAYKKIPDAKFLSCLGLYYSLKAENKLPF